MTRFVCHSLLLEDFIEIILQNSSQNGLVNGLTHLNLTTETSQPPTTSPHFTARLSSSNSHVAALNNQSIFPQQWPLGMETSHSKRHFLSEPPMSSNLGLAMTDPTSQSHTSASSVSSQSHFLQQGNNLSHDQQDDSDSDEETTLSHPNKFPVEIEHHDNRFCSYKRQPTRYILDFSLKCL